MASLAKLLEYRASLEDARYSGTRRVRDSTGEEIELKSDAELSRALTAVNRDIAGYSGSTRTIQYPLTSKGL